MAQPAPGWYEDPTDPLQQRYWDGTTWTDHVAPRPVAPAAAPPAAAMPTNFGGAAAPARPTSTKATLSLVLSIVSWVALPVLAAIAGVILGHLARAEIRGSGGRIQGDGLATAGLIVGYLNLVVALAIAVFFIVVFAVFAGAAGT